MKSNLSQISVEYILIVGFALVVVVPLLIIFMQYSSSSSSAASTNQAFQIARKIIEESEEVFYIGNPAQTTITANFPENIQSISLSDKEVVFKIKTANGVTEIVQVSKVNITGTLPTSAGIHVLKIKAEKGYVLVTSN